MGFRTLERPPAGTAKDRRAGWASSSAEFAAGRRNQTSARL